MPTLQPTQVTISTATIIKIVLVALGLWALYLIADILLLVIASLLLAAAIDPFVDRLQKFGIPRAVSMIVIYLIAFLVVTVALYLIIPPLAQQIGAIARDFPALYTQVNEWMTRLSPNEANSSSLPIPSALSTATNGIFSFISYIFGGIFSLLTVVVLTFYLVVDEGAIRRTVAIAPPRYHDYLTDLYERLQQQIGLWLRAQLILMALIGVLTYVLLSALRLVGFDMPYALTLALIAGLTEFIPYVGPVIGAVPAVFLAYAVSPTSALLVAVIYYGVQTLENNVFVPKIMERALGLSPIISIVVFLIGAKLAGITGAFLAIPIATAGAVIMKDLVSKRGEPKAV